MGKIPTLNCRQCGAEIKLPEQAGQITCPYCGTPQVLDTGGLLFHYYMPPGLNAAEGKKVLMEWMSRPDKAKNLNLKAGISKFELKFAPIWLFKFVQGGKEEVILETANPELHWCPQKLPPGELKFFDETKVKNAVEPSIKADNALTRMETRLGFGEQAGHGEAVEKELVHFPMYLASYGFGGTEYTAAVDASSGEVFATSFPRRGEHPFILLGAGTVVLLTIIHSLTVFGIYDATCTLLPIGILLTFAAAMLVAERY